MLVDAGYADVRVEEKAESREFIKDWMPGRGGVDHKVHTASLIMCGDESFRRASSITRIAYPMSDILFKGQSFRGSLGSPV